MNEEILQSTESSNDSISSPSMQQTELEQMESDLAILRQKEALRDEATFRLNLLAELAAVRETLQLNSKTTNENLVLVTQKISNVAKMLYEGNVATAQARGKV